MHNECINFAEYTSATNGVSPSLADDIYENSFLFTFDAIDENAAA